MACPEDTNWVKVNEAALNVLNPPLADSFSFGPTSGFGRSSRPNSLIWSLLLNGKGCGVMIGVGKLEKRRVEFSSAFNELNVRPINNQMRDW